MPPMASDPPTTGAGTVDPAWIERVANGRFAQLWRRQPPYRAGRWIPLSLQRRFVVDLLHFAKKVPSVPMQKTMALAERVAARRAARSKVSWSAIFTKAYAIISAARPELRRSFLSFPWPHLYEHEFVVASVGIERDCGGEPGVFFGNVPTPQTLRLVEIDALIRHFKTAPIESIESFRTVLRLSRLPKPLRRFVWWFGLNVRGLYRATFFGTFGISVVAALGAAGLHLLSPLTTTLNYGTFQDDGRLDVRATYDHRVMDGATVARALADLERVLMGEILAELRADA